MSRFLTAALLCVLAVNAALTAQGSKQPAAFAVSSIKPIQPYPPYPNFFIEINKLRGNHVTARMAVAAAYGVDRRQVVGGPAWVDSDSHDRSRMFLLRIAEEGPLEVEIDVPAIPVSSMTMRSRSPVRWSARLAMGLDA